MNTVPGAMPPVTRATAVTAPRRERNRTRPPSATPARAASAGWSSTTASGTSQSRVATRRLIVPPW